MIVVELILLILAYTVLIIALFLEVICYTRKIESLETITFTASLLILILAFSISPLLDQAKDTSLSSIFTLLSMILVSATTFLNVLNERQQNLKPWLKQIHITVAASLFTAGIIAHFMGYLLYIQDIVIAFLILSVVASMFVVLFTKPTKEYAHLEKADRISAIGFITLVPLYLILHYAFEEQYKNLQIGFILPIAFILLACNKIYDDLKRLSIVTTGIEPQKQHFINYGLTEREEEIAILLSKGITYQNIADRLFISLPTVKTHAGNIYKKCGVKSRHELTVLIIN